MLPLLATGWSENRRRVQSSRVVKTLYVMFGAFSWSTTHGVRASQLCDIQATLTAQACNECLHRRPWTRVLNLSLLQCLHLVHQKKPPPCPHGSQP